MFVDRRGFLSDLAELSGILGIGLFLRGTLRGEHHQARPIMLGLIDSLFESEQEDKLILAQIAPFADRMRKLTGVSSDMCLVRGVESMSVQLKEGKLDLAILHGLELGWVLEKCPGLQSLAVAVNERPMLQAVFLVRHDSSLVHPSELRERTLALSRRNQHHVRHFLAESIPADSYSVSRVRSAEEAVEDVIDGKAEATVVNQLTWEVYTQRKPARAKRLKVLAQSANYPAAAIVSVPNDNLRKEREQLRDSLLKFHSTPEGRQALTLMRLTHFAAIPEEYEKQVTEIAKQYPMRKPG